MTTVDFAPAQEIHCENCEDICCVRVVWMDNKWKQKRDFQDSDNACNDGKGKDIRFSLFHLTQYNNNISSIAWNTQRENFFLSSSSSSITITKGPWRWEWRKINFSFSPPNLHHEDRNHHYKILLENKSILTLGLCADFPACHSLTLSWEFRLGSMEHLGKFTHNLYSLIHQAEAIVTLSLSWPVIVQHWRGLLDLFNSAEMWPLSACLCVHCVVWAGSACAIRTTVQLEFFFAWSSEQCSEENIYDTNFAAGGGREEKAEKEEKKSQKQIIFFTFLVFCLVDLAFTFFSSLPSASSYLSSAFIVLIIEGDPRQHSRARRGERSFFYVGRVNDSGIHFFLFFVSCN